jgi:hypothetical protein
MYNYIWLSIFSALVLSCVFLSDDQDCHGDIKSNNNLRNKTAFKVWWPLMLIFFLFILVCQVFKTEEYGVNK